MEHVLLSFPLIVFLFLSASVHYHREWPVQVFFLFYLSLLFIILPSILASFRSLGFGFTRGVAFLAFCFPRFHSFVHPPGVVILIPETTRICLSLHRRVMQQSIMKVLLLLGLLALVSASPLQKRGVYKVERVANPNFTGRNGPRALLKTLRKYRMPVPAHGSHVCSW